MKGRLYRLITSLLIVFQGVFAVSGQNPVANFTASPLAGCSPLIVSFQNLSTGATAYNWTFGNGNTSTLQNPIATYFTPGTYTVTLLASNANGSNTLTRTNYITVYESPVVDFNANPRSGCFPLRVQFTDLSSPGTGNTNVSWQWDFGNGTTSTLRNPTATYLTAGLFTVTLKVTNDKGCTKTLSRPNYISVNQGVVAAFTNTQPTVCSHPADISFTNNSTGPPTLSYLWDFGDGNFSGVTNPVHTYNSSGSFIATLIVTSTAGCIDTVRHTIVIGGFTTSFTSPPGVCINLPASFTNTSTPAPISSNWTFGDGGVATGLNATHIYTTPGVYTVWLYNTYSICRDSISHTITVNPKPTADFTAPVTTKCQPPLTINFQDISTGSISGWQWDFGDGGTSILQNPSHTYNSYGNFTVRLIATNTFGCKDTIVKTDYIRIKRAVITIAGLPAKGCIPYTITPVPTVVSLDAVTSYNWNFGDGGTSTVANPIYTYTTQGTYTVRLIITTSSGCTDTLTLTNTVKVGSKPVANFSATPLSVCARQPVTFTDLSVPADEWLWDFGDGSTSTQQNPVHNYNDTGYFSIRLIAINNGCPDTITRFNYVYVLPPIAKFISTPDCTNRLRFSFTDQSIAPLTWAWDFGDATTATIQNPVHVFPALGTYTVTLVVTNGACTDMTTRTVRVVDESPDFVAAQVSACHIATIPFHAQNLNYANIASYFWDFGDGNTLTTTVPDTNHIYTTSGTYTVKLVTTDINGCQDSITKTNYIRINGPTAGFSATNVAGCTGLVTTFNDLSVTDGINAIANWRWDFGDGFIQNFSGPPFQHTYNTPGTFSVKLQVTDASGCKDSIILVNIVTATDPIPDFVSADTLTCPGATVSFSNTSVATGFTSQWNFGDAGTSGATNPTHVYATTGLYTVKLRIQDSYGCADSITKNQYIRVDKPLAGFTVSDSVSSCIPLEVQFTNTSTFYSSVYWDFGPGQGNTTLNNPIHYFSAPGNFPVKLIVTSPGGCKDSMIKNIRVYDTIGSRMTYTPLSGCTPLGASFDVFTTGPIASYYWDFGDGYTLSTTSPNITHIYLSYGNFLPKVIMQDPSGCLIPLAGFDTVYATGAKAKFDMDKKVFCDFGTVTFSDSTTFNDPVTNYFWNFGDGGTSTLQNPVHQYNSPGSYTVTLTVQTQAGCRDTLAKPNIVRIVQRPVIDIGGDSVVCVNSSLIHSGVFLQPDTSIVTWSWNFPNGNTSTQQNPAPQVYKVAGTFTVTSVATNSTGCKDTTTQSILVNPLPVITIPGQMTMQAGFPVMIPATYSPGTISWLWSPALGLSCTSCPNPVAGPKFNTFYQVYFTDTNNCSNIGAIEVIVICKNANLYIPNTFTPNGDGSNDMFYPRGKGLERVKLLRIFNRWGEVVFERRDFPINDALTGWDGSFKGKKPQPDVYVYQVEVFCDNGDIIRLNGNIALIL